MRRYRRRLLLAPVLPLVGIALQVTPALACGGLVAPDGEVHLDQATTFVAWHAGVERYVTSFAFSGSVADVGWIVPLPAVPTAIQSAGRWTLQRLELEFNPPKQTALAAGAAEAAPSASSVVVEQVQVEALDVTILKGSGQAVIDWCLHNGFELPPETQDHLLQYAKASPIFMAARYDNAAASAQGLRSGDGVPLLITMNTPQLWVPLEVLANDNDAVNADLFLLSDQPLHPAQSAPLLLLPPFSFGSTGNVDGASGFTLTGSESLSPDLYDQLSADRNMGWMPKQGWLTYLRLRAPSNTVTYDLGVGHDNLIRLAAFGTPPARTVLPAPADHTAVLFASLSAGGALTLTLGAVIVIRRRSHKRARLAA